MQNLYQKVEKFVKESFEGKKYSHTPSHLFDTVECVILLNPDANLELKIAALCHDIDRAYRDRTVKTDGFKGPVYLKDHQENSANIAKDFLMENNAPKELVDRVWELISKHEEGGDKDQNLLKDADSLSFFRNKNYIEVANKYGKDYTKEKLDWTFERITSLNAKELAKPMYEKALEELLKFE